MRNALRRVVVLGVMAVAALTLGISTPAGAQTGDDSSDNFQLIENVPAATETLTDGVQGAVDTAMETQSTVETFYALMQTVALTGDSLFHDGGQFEYLRVVPWLVERETRFAVDDYLGVIDGTHGPDDLLTVQDIQTMVDNAEPALDFIVESVAMVTIDALNGDLVRAAFGTVGLVALPEDGGVASYLAYGTNLNEESIVLVAVADATFFVVSRSGYGESLSGAEESLAPVFEAAQPAVAPIINLLGGL